MQRVLETLERETGIEPATSSLGSWRSTAELLPLTSEVQIFGLMRISYVIQIIIPRELICKDVHCSILAEGRSVHPGDEMRSRQQSYRTGKEYSL